MRFIALLIACWSVSCWAVDPFEDFHEYGQLTDAEIHEIHQGEMFYGDAEFGFIVTRGNTDSTSFKLRSNIYQDFTHWRNQFKFDSLYRRDVDAETGEETISAQRFFGSAQTNYKVGEKNASLFFYADYEEDEFSGLEYKATVATGYGNRLYKGVKNTVDFDIGPGLYRSEGKPAEEGEEPTESETGYLLRLALQWERTVSKRTRFNQFISAEQSLSGLNSRLKSETSLISQIMGQLSLKFAYLYRYNSKPEEDKRKFDSELSATFVYSFN
ncbi:hypothetical protein W04_2041 [Pseudoalteromonas sp. SW0106-04]|uniref:DUF481 domain-containing protein n=1 Tax=Pseudoalteromonas sp. SW0106-04 TaxID=1702169 RepID=UPI0006B66354|nr:DUF481 domain-containing protein [Pseudoalteromonas sp. SW0106-04]GAP75511.1 hypothetical protein W04_2041 [Pseudoalteromonas sp. SW0106-04]